MNSQRKKSAVTKYGPITNGGKTLEEIRLELDSDEKNYTEDEINEIMSELGDPSSPNPNNNPAAKSKKKSKDSEDGHYEEWEVKIDNGKAEKLRLSRACVKITEEEAATLNAGILEGSNTYSKMYFEA